ncbi:ABC transporter ATP-binding protein [Clostridium sp. KNHs216]|uniref:ABC transporter ATP-binding protein n=1 Tax=Clostridium sp. KNHs216 TaxID=1550235 RepID=UPI001150C9A2|nr:ABC transporter ATP-binding protein [Clostridium sp. KNHs216]TQI68316.1 branched-chain amino acid transport system ATP-binding protein [Clostridium sp. KNHs216]
MLKIDNINVFYGKVQALFNVSFEIGGNEIVSVIGANGAGKSTLMKTIMGLNKTPSGMITMDGTAISNLPTHEIVKKGIVYVPEGREIFPDLNVYENLVMGAYSKPFSKRELNEHIEKMYDMFPRLKERKKQAAGCLSGGEQQMVAIARGLISDPKLIMFDEPSLGLAPIIVDEVFDIILRINKEMNIPIVIVEQNAFMAMSISSRTYVLEVGKITTTGNSAELMNSPVIKQAYLGG